MEEFDAEVEGWFPLLIEVDLPPLFGADLFEVVKRRLLLLVVWMAGVGGGLSPCLFLGLMGWPAFWLRSNSLGSGLRVCWMHILP